MKYLYLIPLMLLLVLTGCTDDNNTNPTPGGTGRLIINLTDAPADYDAINITVSSVEVHRNGEWIVANSNLQTVDLLELQNGATILFCDTLLPVGKYTQIRLIVTEAEVVVNGIAHPLDIPSGEQSGLKLIHQFTIEQDFTYELLLDFDAHRSIIQTGNGQYKLKPTIRVVPIHISGIITGRIIPVDAMAFVWTTHTPDTMSTTAASDGFFKLIGLPEGQYSLYIEPQDSTLRDTVITGINVINGQQTDIGTVILTP